MSKLAKCGIHSLSFCNQKHDAPQCTNCTFVKRRPKKRIIQNGITLVYCPQCNQYKPANEFKPNKNGYLSWCMDCKHLYGRTYPRKNKQSFMVGYRNDKGMRKFIKVDSTSKMIKLVKQHMIENNEKTLEIKRL